ncbi:MAG: hypothetical protein WEB00_13185 [Dehalococcoidia bacterium]
MKYFALGLLVTFLALLAASAVPTTAGHGSFVVEESGTGTGGPNQSSTLRASCGPEAIILSHGFFGIDPGTSVLSSHPINQRIYQVVWRNDDTADTVTVRVTCFHTTATASVVFQNFPGTAHEVTTGEVSCGPKAFAINGGFRGLAPTSSPRAVVDAIDYIFWRTTWRSGATPDQVGVYAYCIQRAGTLITEEQVTGEGDGGPNQYSKLELTCEEEFSLVGGVGVKGLDQGTKLVAFGPLDTQSARIAWRNDTTPDEVIFSVLCIVLA